MSSQLLRSFLLASAFIVSLGTWASPDDDLRKAVKDANVGGVQEALAHEPDLTLDMARQLPERSSSLSKLSPKVLTKKLREKSSSSPSLMDDVKTHGLNYDRPIHVALAMEHSNQIFNLLLQKHREKGHDELCLWKNEAGNSLIHLAILNGRIEELRQLLSYNQHFTPEAVNMPNGEKKSPIQLAITVSGDLGVLRMLLEAGASANQIDDLGSPAIDQAFQADRMDMVIALIKHGATVPREMSLLVHQVATLKNDPRLLEIERRFEVLPGETPLEALRRVLNQQEVEEVILSVPLNHTTVTFNPREWGAPVGLTIYSQDS